MGWGVNWTGVGLGWVWAVAWLVSESEAGGDHALVLHHGGRLPAVGRGALQRVLRPGPPARGQEASWLLAEDALGAGGGDAPQTRGSYGKWGSTAAVRSGVAEWGLGLSTRDEMIRASHGSRVSGSASTLRLCGSRWQPVFKF